MIAKIETSILKMEGLYFILTFPNETVKIYARNIDLTNCLRGGLAAEPQGNK
jgi:hypothetical protein